MRYMAEISYDGSDFLGFQKQPGMRTVENELEKALYNINNHTPTRLYSSGRTDRGVHALGQVIHFDLDIDITTYKLKCAINSLTPDDIHVISTEIVDKNFHSRFSVKEKTYIYKINVGEFSPIMRKYILQYNKPLDVNKMKEGLNYFLGKHNFKAFASEEVIKNNYIRNIKKVDIQQEDNIIIISFTADGFMKYQVRNMVGTLIKIGSNKLNPSIILEIFKDYSKRKYITTAKPEGLYLKKVYYKDQNQKLNAN